GWHLHQHMDNEFYQEWGDFKVNITVPKGFILGATGNLINSDEAMQDTTKEVRDWFLHNMDDTTSTTTWKYEAHNVHDFAWSADPDYRYITRSWDGIDVHYLVMDENYESWKKETLAGYGSVRFLSEKFGRYPYDQITVADTYIDAGGMEYPGIVFINTNYNPDYYQSYFRGVVIHEIAHNWFYGLLGSNQTEFEWLDEGFTQFAEILG
ncbi:MAG: M1 family metallopeptidase, partial [Gammaproteobacteria bacterium]|nr:M1 family metallopeptidase [Gammaproteobacteria bacterium]